MSRKLDSASAASATARKNVFGELKVTATVGFGTLWLAPRLVKLYEKYPDLRIDLLLEERVLDRPCARPTWHPHEGSRASPT